MRARDTARLALQHMDPPAPAGLMVAEAEALLELDQGDWVSAKGVPR